MLLSTGGIVSGEVWGRWWNGGGTQLCRHCLVCVMLPIPFCTLLVHSGRGGLLKCLYLRLLVMTHVLTVGWLANHILGV